MKEELLKIKELKHFMIGYSYGGNQDWFRSYMMRLGGCGAETACDLSIYLKMYKGKEEAYSRDTANITRPEYVEFAHEMKKYLWPRMMGIDKTSTWISGYGKYLNDRGVSGIEMHTIEGDAPYAEAEEVFRGQIDKEIPVPCLTLRHKDKTFGDYNWHWFLLNGYKVVRTGEENRLMVKAVTYSEYEWLDFERLWNTGYDNKGGLVLLNVH